MEAWMRVGLNYMRALRHPCLVSDLQTRDVCIRMDPHEQFCHNRRCRAYGRSGEGHLVIHSHKERRYRCKRCGRTFSESKGTALYRVHEPKWLLLAVVTLLTAVRCRPSSPPSISMSAPSPAGRRNPACNAGGYMST